MCVYIQIHVYIYIGALKDLERLQSDGLMLDNSLKKTLHLIARICERREHAKHDTATR